MAGKHILLAVGRWTYTASPSSKLPKASDRCFWDRVKCSLPWSPNRLPSRMEVCCSPRDRVARRGDPKRLLGARGHLPAGHARVEKGKRRGERAFDKGLAEAAQKGRVGGHVGLDVLGHVVLGAAVVESPADAQVGARLVPRRLLPAVPFAPAEPAEDVPERWLRGPALRRASTPSGAAAHCRRGGRARRRGAPRAGAGCAPRGRLRASTPPVDAQLVHPRERVLRWQREQPAVAVAPSPVSSPASPASRRRRSRRCASSCRRALRAVESSLRQWLRAPSASAARAPLQPRRRAGAPAPRRAACRRCRVVSEPCSAGRAPSACSAIPTRP